TPGLHRTEATATGAGVAEHHEGGGARGPALAHVRAAGLLADGVEAAALQDAAQPVDLWPLRQGDLQPAGLLTWGDAVVDGHGGRERGRQTAGRAGTIGRRGAAREGLLCEILCGMPLSNTAEYVK